MKKKAVKKTAKKPQKHKLSKERRDYLDSLSMYEIQAGLACRDLNKDDRDYVLGL